MHYQVELTDWSEDKAKEFVESPWFDYDAKIVVQYWG